MVDIDNVILYVVVVWICGIFLQWIDDTFPPKKKSIFTEHIWDKYN